MATFEQVLREPAMHAAVAKMLAYESHNSPCDAGRGTGMSKYTIIATGWPTLFADTKREALRIAATRRGRGACGVVEVRNGTDPVAKWTREAANGSPVGRWERYC